MAEPWEAAVGMLVLGTVVRQLQTGSQHQNCWPQRPPCLACSLSSAAHTRDHDPAPQSGLTLCTWLVGRKSQGSRATSEPGERSGSLPASEVQQSKRWGEVGGSQLTTAATPTQPLHIYVSSSHPQTPRQHIDNHTQQRSVAVSRANLKAHAPSCRGNSNDSVPFAATPISGCCSWSFGSVPIPS